MAFTRTSALSRKHSICVNRCNNLPFKVAVSARRASCIEGCNATATATVLNHVINSSSRDLKCIKKCNSRKTTHRRTIECIERCPDSSATVSSKQKNEGKPKLIVDTKYDEIHPSLPMLITSEAFAGAEELVEHPSLPMLSINTTSVSTASSDA